MNTYRSRLNSLIESRESLSYQVRISFLRIMVNAHRMISSNVSCRCMMTIIHNMIKGFTGTIISSAQIRELELKHVIEYYLTEWLNSLCFYSSCNLQVLGIDEYLTSVKSSTYWAPSQSTEYDKELG